MLGAIIGDIVGSRFEWNNTQSTDFELFDISSRFTDDTVLTIAVADALVSGKPYRETIYHWGNKYPRAGYGGQFRKWLKSDNPQPYNSWGNGSAMRVSPVGFACSTLAEVLEQAQQSALPSHNHPEGIKGAQAIAASVFLARTGKSKAEIKAYIGRQFNYNFNRTIDSIRPYYKFDVSCQGSVPEAIIAFLESTDFESAIRLAISLGGDSDTIACMAGGIAQAFYKEIPSQIITPARNRLTAEQIEVLEQFNTKFM